MFLYSTNKTMQMLGNQYPNELIGKEGIAAEDFGNVVSAHRAKRTNNYFDIGMDFFMLGYIYGKRAERARRNVGVLV